MILNTDQLKEREKIKVKVKKMLPKEMKPTWSKLDKEGKENLINLATEWHFAGINEFDEALKNSNKKMDEMSIFIVGLFLGIFGGLISNIIHDYLSKFGIIYILFSTIIFIGLLYLIIDFFWDESNRSMNVTKFLRDFSHHASDELKKREKIQNNS